MYLTQKIQSNQSPAQQRTTKTKGMVERFCNIDNIFILLFVLCRAGKSGDEVVLDMAQEMMRSIPEEVDVEEADSPSARPGQTFVPTLNDMVNIAQGAINKIQSSKKDSAAKRKRGQKIPHIS